MEERLRQFVASMDRLELEQLESDGTARFVHHQVVELARDCLHKSEEKMISSAYFYELSENLEKLLHDVSYLYVPPVYLYLINSDWTLPVLNDSRALPLPLTFMVFLSHSYVYSRKKLLVEYCLLMFL